MIITRTPFRISFTGGGTDLPGYYSTGYGAVVNATIDKYIYLTVNKRFDKSIRVSYSKTEIVDRVEDLEHDIVKAALKMVGITEGVEITSISDIPAGTGLGSSSSFAVGLINALYTYVGLQLSAHELAEKACQLEIEVLKKPVGKQDQFAAAYGGINYFRFNADGTVGYRPIKMPPPELEKMQEKLSIWYTGINRSAEVILAQQAKDTLNKIDVLDYMKEQADMMAEELCNRGFSETFGESLHNGWQKKKSITRLISNSDIDRLYEAALDAGARGGKILGAGGGGFLLFYCDAEKTEALRDALGLEEMKFKITKHGSRVVYFSEN